MKTAQQEVMKSLKNAILESISNESNRVNEVQKRVEFKLDLSRQIFGSRDVGRNLENILHNYEYSNSKL